MGVDGDVMEGVSEDPAAIHEALVCLCNLNHKVLEETKEEFRRREEELVEKLQKVCRHHVVVYTKTIWEKKGFWGFRTKEIARKGGALCVFCGLCSHFSLAGNSWEDPIKNCLARLELSLDEFDRYRKEWKWQPMVTVAVPVGLFTRGEYIKRVP